MTNRIDSAEPPIDPLARFSLDGRVAIVTGASGGLGARFARVLDRAGARVVVAARRQTQLEEVAGSLTGGLAVQCDLTSARDVDELVQRTMEAYGHIDVLINNAGQTDEMTAALEQAPDHFRSILEINLVAPFRVAQRVAREMLNTGGAILNVASVLGLVGHPEKPQAGYTASKGGLINLTRELASQWGPYGIRVNSLAPGLFRSEMTAVSFTDPESMAKIRGRTPLGRSGSLDELDGVVLFLVSAASSYMTGQCIVVDGGYTAL